MVTISNSILRNSCLIFWCQVLVSRLQAFCGVAKLGIVLSAGFASISFALIALTSTALTSTAWAQQAAPDPNIAGEAYVLSRYGPAAEAGDPNAQYLLGYSYDTGLGTAVDKKIAAEWYAKAADQGDTRAQFRLAVMLHLGEGVSEDLSRAALLYRQAAKAGVLEAQYNLGQMMELGLGMEAAPWVAKELYETAAEAGLPAAMTALGNLLARGFIGEAGEEEPDPVTAMIWLTKAVSAGDATASSLLALVDRTLSEEQRKELADRLQQ